MKEIEPDKMFKVLIVDDERTNLHLLYHTLRSEYDIVAANSGEKAIELVKSEKPDLILLDIMMPEMDGFEVLKKLKFESSSENIPVIFITSLASPQDETKGLFLGAVDYITKPLNADVVRARVRTHLRIVKQMRIIEELGMIDALTNIANRRRFDTQLEIEWMHSIREQKPISLLIMDIDNFKHYNDKYGHPAGDAFLQTFTRTAAVHVRRSTDLFARLGGEEFAFLLPDTDSNGAVVFAEDVRSTIERLNIPSGIDPTAPITVSIGVESLVPDVGNLSAEFIESCDKKLYIAKKSGRNKVVYNYTL